MAATRTTTSNATDTAQDVFLSPAALRVSLMTEDEARGMIANLDHSDIDWESLVTLKILLPDALAMQLLVPQVSACNRMVRLMANAAAGRFVTLEEARIFRG